MNPATLCKTCAGEGRVKCRDCHGSGEVLAAEITERRCGAIEIEPRYCDVIIERWERHAGKKAKRQRP